MASHSPQRSRRPTAHQPNQGPMHTLQPRETSRSPSIRERPRAMKTQSMPLVPSVAQAYPAGGSAPQASQVPQSSPTSSNTSRRSPPTGVQVTRLLPTPPHPNPPNIHDTNSERRNSSPPPQTSHSQSNIYPHNPRPINRIPQQFLTKFQNMDENWQMTEELLADIERADQQQAHSQNIPSHPYSAGYPRGESPSPPKDPGVERVRATERSSPKDSENGQTRRQRDAAAIRDSPKTRDRQPNSPIVASFVQSQSLTPERRMSPAIHISLGSPGEHPSNFSQYVTRDSPPVLRRANTTANIESRSQLSLSSQTPPLQNITARTPDRSLPVQEEPEEELGVTPKTGTTGSRDSWKATEQGRLDHEHRSSSPSPDILQEAPLYDSHSGQGSRAGHRDESDLHEQETVERRYIDRDHAEDEGGYTPRSPTAGLPDEPSERFVPTQNVRNLPVRARTRNGATDQLGLRTLDPALFDQPSPANTTSTQNLSDRPPKYVEPQRSAQDDFQQYQQTQRHRNNPRAYNGQIYPPQVYPDDFQNFVDDPAAAYIQAYFSSPRPDAPIPPTPHSQTAAPSPSPFMAGNYEGSGKDLPPFSPIAPVGSPYPYPFTHVRRNANMGNHPNRPQFPSNHDPNNPSIIQEQIAKQWQIYAQNNLLGNMTDSTFSPSSTPFQGAYHPWASLHMNRLAGRMHDTTSIQSSPSHEPLPLPSLPTIKRKDRNQTVRRHSSHRKPPPRVESTQPRETSPELSSSSGEETAGEERLTAPAEVNWVNGGAVQAVHDDNNGDWIDDDDDADENDLLELEYHPSFVNNAEKRRRRWEIGWESLSQAFQTLDRQTDATLILLAAPSHSTKLHMLKSRAIRRQPALSDSVDMSGLRSSFQRVATQRRNTRSQKASLIDRFLVPSAASGDGSDSSESREEDLKRALEAALGSLGALSGIYEQREARWVDEMRRVSEDRERVEFLLRQVLGENHPMSHLPKRP